MLFVRMKEPHLHLLPPVTTPLLMSREKPVHNNNHMVGVDMMIATIERIMQGDLLVEIRIPLAATLVILLRHHNRIATNQTDTIIVITTNNPYHSVINGINPMLPTATVATAGEGTIGPMSGATIHYERANHFPTPTKTIRHRLLMRRFLYILQKVQWSPPRIMVSRRAIGSYHRRR